MCTRSELSIILKEVAKAYRSTYGENLSRIILYGSYARHIIEILRRKES